MGEIVVEQLKQEPLADQQVELVERKGKGHPDSICDAIANCASVALCDQYKKAFGRILHHNLDKMLLVAGRSAPRLGGGQIHEPMKLIFGDRGTALLGDQAIDLGEVVSEAAKAWVRANLRFVDPDRYLVFQNEIRPASAQLTSLFDHASMRANDTSVATGFAPLSPTERVVLSLEKHMNSREFKAAFPETGEDIKVMAFRNHQQLHLTIAVAFVDRLVPTRAAYFRRKSEIADVVAPYVHSTASEFERVHVEINTLDDPQADEGMYLTVLGTSAEGSDSGQVGRGNRANGLIASHRPQSIEAHAGKNPLSHVGKIYSYLTTHIAQQIYSQVAGLREVHVSLCSQIGRPIDDPFVSSLKLVLAKGASLDDVKSPAESILQQELANIAAFTSQLASQDFYCHWEDRLT